ncbi:MAG: response regulator [Verrucomicrobiota bacterium]|nr:response regulator [Limisphaera sp.]MDW8382652.1 response regulator [Verrucomicrobiota bacterium]
MPPVSEPIPEADFTPPPILVVDDEEIVLAALRETLRRTPYEVITEADPVAAVELLKQQEFSVIITDQSMPGLSGLELLARARQLQPFATRILITAVLSLDTVIDAINKGEIYRFIVKPWLREEFLATIKNAVQRYQLICQNAHLQAATQEMNKQLVELNRSLEQQVKLVAQQNEQLAQMNAALERNLMRSLELCVHTMQTFYPSLGSQARRVAALCKGMAQIAQLSLQDRRVLESSALLHDIGLVGVPRQIIRRWQDDPSSLNPAETALIEQHPILGQELAGFTSDLDQVGQIIRAHHERYDGSGYPDQLVGENIPWLARLLAVAVAWASSPLPAAEATARIQQQAGTAFDPEAVRIFLQALHTVEIPRKEREVSLAELRPGMVLARGVYTANGLLLIPEGQRLNATFIEKLLNHHRIQPITQSLVVYC